MGRARMEISNASLRTRANLTRRDWLRLGGLSLFGLNLSSVLGSQFTADSRRPISRGGFGRAKSAILIFLKGGPSHLDTFDMKPGAPTAIRGEFRPIATAVPGLHVCEHLPRLARQAGRIMLLRSLTHRDHNHASAAYEMTTGHPYPRASNL